MADVIYDEVKLNASRIHKVTGHLANSIYSKLSKSKSTATKKVFRIGWDERIAPEGKYLEFGTSRMAAQPFVRPAVDAMPRAIEAGQAAMKATK